MNSALKRGLGFVLIIVAVISLVLTALGLAGMWAVRGRMIAAVSDAAALFSDTLQTTDKALNVAVKTLDDAHLSIASLVGTTQSIASSLRDGQPAVKSVTQLLRQDLPTTIESAHTAVTSAAQTAKGIDDLLNQLARIPLINLDYRPSQPLAESVTGIGATLADMPAKLQDIAGNLETLSGDLATIANQVGGLGTAIQQIDSNLSDAGAVIREYQAQVARALPVLQSIQQGAGNLITLVLGVLTFILAWLIILQLIALELGLRWSRKP